MGSLTGGRRHGFEIIQEINGLSGTVYPILWRMKGAGFVSAVPERGNAVKLGRPLRKYYSLTGAGRKALKGAT